MLNPEVVRLGWQLWKVQSSSDWRHYYFVELRHDTGEECWICDCRGYEKTCIIRLTDCRHIRLVKALYPEVHAPDLTVPCEPRLLSEVMRGWGDAGGRGEEKEMRSCTSLEKQDTRQR